MLTLLGTEVEYSTGKSLTIPDGTKYLVVTAALVGTPGVSSVSIGGVSLAPVANNVRHWWADITGRSNDTLAVSDLCTWHACYLDGNDMQEAASGTLQAGTDVTVDQTESVPITGSNLFGVAEVAGVSADLIGDWPPVIETQLSDVATIGGPGAVDEDVRVRCRSGSVVGVRGAWAFFYEAAPDVVAELSGIGETSDFRGLTVAPSGPSMAYLVRWGERSGFRGLTVRASGPRQVALVGRGLGTSEMTDVPVGLSVPVLRHRAAAKPAFEELATLAAEAGIGIGGDTTLLIDASVSGAHTVDRNDAATHDLTLTGDATLTPGHSDPTAGEAIDLRLLIRQDGTGGWTLAWGGTISWAGGSEPTMPTDPDALLTVGLLSVDDATTWLGYVADADAAIADILDIPTAETDTDLRIAPDGAGGVEWAAGGTVDGPTLVALGVVGALLISDDHSTPIVFADLLLTEDGSDLLYSDVG